MIAHRWHRGGRTSGYTTMLKKLYVINFKEDNYRKKGKRMAIIVSDKKQNSEQRKLLERVQKYWPAGPQMT